MNFRVHISQSSLSWLLALSEWFSTGLVLTLLHGAQQTMSGDRFYSHGGIL